MAYTLFSICGAGISKKETTASFEKKYMGQAGYPNLQRVGYQNMWINHGGADHFNQSYFFQGSLIEQLGHHYLELLTGGYKWSFPHHFRGEVKGVQSYLKSFHTTYFAYRLNRVRSASLGRIWFLFYRS